MSKVIKTFILASLSMLLFQACETDDVAPTVTLDTSATTLDFAGGTVEIIARLNGPSSEEVSVSVQYSGTAVAGVDYQNPPNEIRVPSGQTSGSITLVGIQTSDTSARFIQVDLISARNALVGGETEVVIQMIDCLGDRDGDGVANCEDECPDEAGPVENNGCPFLGLIINEVLYDPAAGSAGDANNDGIRDPLEDEFAELYNDGLDLDISGYTLSDASMVRHIFPEGTVVPGNSAIVVFGGGTPTGAFGGSIVQTASEGQLNLNNAGDILIVADAEGNIIAEFDINPLSGNPDEAYTRNPDITGDFARHPTIPEANGALFSPGTRLDGSNF